jgi:hypothetical protein
MLSMLRKKKTMKRILWGLAIIIIPAFVLWGAGSLTKESSPYKYIGTIDGKKVTIDDFIESAKDVQINLFLNYFSQPEVLDKFTKDRKFINKLAWENILFHEGMKNTNITVSDKEVIYFITNHPLFTKNGVFDEKLYNYIIKNSFGMTPRTFEESVRRFLKSTKFRTTLVENVTVSDEELLQYYKNEFEKAEIYYTVINRESFLEKINITEEEIDSFYENNKNIFMEAEKVIVEYITFNYKNAEEREAALQKIRLLYEKLRSNPENMKSIASKMGEAVLETKPFSQNEVVDGVGAPGTLNTAAFSMKPGTDILPLIDEESDGSSYLIRVKEIKAPSVMKKDKVSDKIIDILKTQKAEILAEKEILKIYTDAKDNNLSLKTICDKYNLPLMKTEFITRLDYIEGVGESYIIIDEAFKLNPGSISPPIKTRKGFAIVEPSQFLYIDNEKFEEEKIEYMNRVLSTKKMKALEDWFNNINKKATLNVDLDRI